MKLKDLKVSLLSVNGPSSWPSLAIVRPALKKQIQGFFPGIKEFQILVEKDPPLTDDLWIVPIGQVQAYFFNWLKSTYPSPYKRPRMLFFLSGEGAKAGYTLFHYKDIFRVDDEWLVASHVEKKLIDDFFPGNNRTHVLHYPVTGQFRESGKGKNALRKKLDLPLKRPIMLYAGRISWQKNVLQLLDVLEQQKDLHLVVCGDADTLGLPHFNTSMSGHLPTLFSEEIIKRKLGARIEFRGFLSQLDLRDMMLACDYQISLSAHYGEDFGYSIAQGFCCGLKTVLSSWGGHLNWKGFFRENELTYVKLDWEGPVGVPVLKNLVLPNKRKKDFYKIYQENFKEQFKSIVFAASFSERKINIVVSEELKKYWSDVRNEKRTVMFTSNSDPIFQKIVKNYSNFN